MSQISLDKSLFPEKEKPKPKTINGAGNGAVQVTPLSTAVGRPHNQSLDANGVSTLYVDVHEPAEIVELLKLEKGINVRVVPLKSGDYAFSNVGIERKTMRDFYNSIVHGDKHIWKQIFNLKHCFDRPMLIIERWDETFLTNPRIERTMYGAIASIFLMGVSVIMIPGKGQNLRPFIEILSFLFFSSDKKALSMRPVPEKDKERTKKEVLSDVLCMIPGIGRKQADIIKDHVNSVEEICKLSDEELQKMCPRLGPSKLQALRWILNGKDYDQITKEEAADRQGNAEDSPNPK